MRVFGFCLRVWADTGGWASTSTRPRFTPHHGVSPAPGARARRAPRTRRAQRARLAQCARARRAPRAPSQVFSSCWAGRLCWDLFKLSNAASKPNIRWRPYRVECTGSLPTSEVKRRRARLVLGWGTAREDLRVLSAFGARPGELRCVCGARQRAVAAPHSLPRAEPASCAWLRRGRSWLPPPHVLWRSPMWWRAAPACASADGHTASNTPDLF